MSGENEVPEEVIKEARTMGWRPKEEFRGNADKWVDAEEFVEKGRHVMPILLENNKRLTNELLTRDQKIGTLESQIKDLREAQERLDGYATKANERELEQARTNLKTRLKQAREDNDVDAELEIQEALGKLTAPVPPVKKKDEAPANKESQVSPEFQAWQAENSWFGGTSPEDKKRTKAYVRIGEDLRDEGNTLSGVEFMEAVGKVYASQQEPENKTGKYEAGSNRESGRRAGNKSYESLPAEAKQACMEDADSLVGPNKKFKTVKDWQADYAKTYWSME